MPANPSRYFHRLQDLPLVDLTDTSQARMLLAEGMLLSFVDFPPGSVFPVHAHEAAQVLIVLEGEVEHTCGGETRTLSAGDLCVHPPNTPRGARTPQGFRGIDIFCPPRPEHVAKLQAKLAAATP
jgi:quercetin dioxygenase-like cupin family protein